MSITSSTKLLHWTFKQSHIATWSDSCEILWISTFSSIVLLFKLITTTLLQSVLLLSLLICALKWPPVWNWSIKANNQFIFEFTLQSYSFHFSSDFFKYRLLNNLLIRFLILSSPSMSCSTYTTSFWFCETSSAIKTITRVFTFRTYS